ncbi:MAG: histidine--tRNA ligase [Candidatus Saccharibacteria bacterium]|nr:histidine--tRNA ligase [Candidatus Saccharibacteria bacterium]
MKKINTSPISGAQELLPEQQATFNNLKNKIGEVYHAHGFLSIETPTIDRTEILFAKAGGDTEKQVYKVVKTAEAADEADQALRFDHTVPLARYVVEHESDLNFPFKVTQIGRNFRGERAQKGRFREFYQCDVDVIGRGNLPLSYDADVITTLLDAFAKFELGTPVLPRINNRKILNGLLMALGLNTKSQEVFDVIDHAEKVPLDTTKANLEAAGLNQNEIGKIVAFANLHGSRDFVIKNLKNLGIEDGLYNEGVDELDMVLGLIEAQGYQPEADMKIVRGLDYYTGTVFEFVLPEYREIGSVCGGGRYENLTGNFTEQKMPGVGGSIGLTRLFYVLNESGLIKNKVIKPLDYVIAPISENEVEYAFEVAGKLREKGTSVDIILTDKKLGDKLTYAAKIAKYGVVIGEDEVKSGALKAKDFETGESADLEI